MGYNQYLYVLTHPKLDLVSQQQLTLLVRPGIAQFLELTRVGPQMRMLHRYLDFPARMVLKTLTLLSAHHQL